MNALAARVLTPPDPSRELFVVLEQVYRTHGFRATHLAMHDALKRLAEEHRAELTLQGWIL